MNENHKQLKTYKKLLQYWIFAYIWRGKNLILETSKNI